MTLPIVNDLLNTFQIAAKLQRKKRIDKANRDWCECLIFLIINNLDIDAHELRNIKSGIAEKHQVYMSEMLLGESAMRVSMSAIVNHPMYTTLQKRAFFQNFLEYYDSIKAIPTFETECPLFKKRRISFLQILLFMNLVLVPALIFRFLEDKEASLSYFDITVYILMEFAWIIIISVIITFVWEKLFPPKVSYPISSHNNT